jgi:hypothetical protein
VSDLTSEGMTLEWNSGLFPNQQPRCGLVVLTKPSVSNKAEGMIGDNIATSVDYSDWT